MATLIKRPIRPSTKVTKKSPVKSEDQSVLKKVVNLAKGAYSWGSSKKK